MEVELPVTGLGPCPHCGGDVQMRPVAESTSWEYRIVCGGCPWVLSVPVAGHHPDILRLVVEAWNRRV